MRLSVIQGRIDRRILLNYRVAPDVLARRLPSPFRPQLVHGQGLAGICLIRLQHVRPRGLPALLGVGSENMAHRIAVEWDAAERDAGGGRRQGVFILRRDTNSSLNRILGGRCFPGQHGPARFEVAETPERYQASVAAAGAALNFAGRVGRRWPATSVFADVDEVARFFAAGSLGYSAAADGEHFEGLELCCQPPALVPLDVDRIAASYFDDPQRFPPGSIQFDSALVMRGIDHEWRRRAPICCREAATQG